jgi:hypothetical protein
MNALRRRPVLALLHERDGQPCHVERLLVLDLLGRLFAQLDAMAHRGALDVGARERQRG